MSQEPPVSPFDPPPPLKYLCTGGQSKMNSPFQNLPQHAKGSRAYKTSVSLLLHQKPLHHFIVLVCFTEAQTHMAS